MSYIDDFIAANAGSMTRERIEVSLRGAGYDDGEIKAAWRRASRPTDRSMEWAAASTAGTAQIDDYLRAHRDRYTVRDLNNALLKAGHDQAAIDAARARARGAQSGMQTATPSGRGGLLRTWVGAWTAALVLMWGLGVVGALGTGDAETLVRMLALALASALIGIWLLRGAHPGRPPIIGVLGVFAPIVILVGALVGGGILGDVILAILRALGVS